jgi:hypothetical protein
MIESILLRDNKHAAYLMIIKRHPNPEVRAELWAEARAALIRSGYTPELADLLWDSVKVPTIADLAAKIRRAAAGDLFTG